MTARDIADDIAALALQLGLDKVAQSLRSRGYPDADIAAAIDQAKPQLQSVIDADRPRLLASIERVDATVH